MDARKAGIGLVIPTPSARFSQLGNVVFVNDDGELVAIANVFDGSSPGLSTRPPAGLTRLQRPTCRDEVHVTGVRAVATKGIQVEPVPREEYEGVGTAAIVTGMPPQITTSRPLYGYIVKRKNRFRGQGDVVIFGPDIIKRSLNLPRSQVESWIRQNYPLIVAIRPKSHKFKLPVLMVVLEEWISTTWSHLSWGIKDVDSGPTTLGLVEGSASSPPQWQFLALVGRTLTMSTMVGNWMERRPWVVAVDGVCFVDSDRDEWSLGSLIESIRKFLSSWRAVSLSRARSGWLIVGSTDAFSGSVGAAEPRLGETAAESSNTANQSEHLDAPQITTEPKYVMDQNPGPSEAISGPTARQHAGPSRLRSKIITFSLVVAIFSVVLDNAMIPILIPRVTKEFGTLADFGMYISVYLLVSATAQETYRALYSSLSARWVLIFALFLFQAGVTVCALSPTSSVFIIGRAIVGLGSGGVGAGIGHIATSLHGEPMTRFWTLVAIVVQTTVIVAPLLGGFFVDDVTWRWCFYVNLCISPFMAPIALFSNFVHEDLRKEFRKKILAAIDVWGVGILFPALLCLVLALKWGGVQYAWKNSRIIILFAVFGVSALIYIIIQSRDSHRMRLPLPAFKRRSVPIPSLLAIFIAGVSTITLCWLPIYFQTVKNTTALQSAINQCPLLVSSGISSLVGAYTWRSRYFLCLALLGLSTLASGTILFSTLFADTSFSRWFGYEVLAGTGMGICRLVGEVDIHQRPEVDSMVIYSQLVGGCIFVAVGQAVYQNILILRIQDFSPSLTIGAIVSTGLTGLVDLVPRAQVSMLYDAYSKSQKGVFLVGAASAATGVMFTCLVIIRRAIVGPFDPVIR